MSDEEEMAAALVTSVLTRGSLKRRGHFLRAVMAHAAAGLTLLEGEDVAIAAAYRLADAMVEAPADLKRPKRPAKRRR